jgi:hypothetical protein
VFIMRGKKRDLKRLHITHCTVGWRGEHKNIKTRLQTVCLFDELFIIHR